MNEFRLYSKENPYYTDPKENKKLNAIFPSAFREENVFFESVKGRLVNAAKKTGLGLVGNSRSAAYLDFDHDGDLDIIVNNYHGEAVLFRNDQANDHYWLQVRLQGQASAPMNRDAIGARIIWSTPDGKRQMREVHGSIGYMSVHPRTQHFGLGNYPQAELKVIWPNGKEQRLQNVIGDQRLTIRYAPAS